MPELPEVETITRDLRRSLTGTFVERIRVYDGRVIRGMSAAAFKRRIRGRRVTDVVRRGKAIVFFFAENSGHLVAQLMMTGQLIVSSSSAPQKDSRIVFSLSSGAFLHYNDQRLFGRLQIVENLSELKYFRILGPEPLTKDFNAGWMKDALSRRKAPIKSVLMDHTFVAGIGNIYASEILFESGIDPRRPASSLKPAEYEVLLKEITAVLRRAIRQRGTSMNNYRDSAGQKGGFINSIKVYGRENKECGRCSSPIQKLVQSGRSTFFCQRCQN